MECKTKRFRDVRRCVCHTWTIDEFDVCRKEGPERSGGNLCDRFKPNPRRWSGGHRASLRTFGRSASCHHGPDEQRLAVAIGLQKHRSLALFDLDGGKQSVGIVDRFASRFHDHVARKIRWAFALSGSTLLTTTPLAPASSPREAAVSGSSGATEMARGVLTGAL